MTDVSNVCVKSEAPAPDVLGLGRLSTALQYMISISSCEFIFSVCVFVVYAPTEWQEPSVLSYSLTFGELWYIHTIYKRCTVYAVPK